MNLRLQTRNFLRDLRARTLILRQLSRLSRKSISAGMLAATLLLLAALPTVAQDAVPAQTPAGSSVPAAVVNSAAFAAAADPAYPAFVPGELLVGVDNAQVFQAAIARADLQGEVMVAATFQTAAGASESGPTTLLVEVPAGQELAMATALAAQPGVRYVEPNGYVYAAQDGEDAPAPVDPAQDEAVSAWVPPGFAVSDPLYATRQWNLQRMDAARGWQLALHSGHFALPSAAIIVAVVDSGIDRTHPEFNGRLLPGKNYIECDVDEGGFPIYDPLGKQLCTQPVIDDFGHGTHVAGVVAAGMNDGQGVAGVAPMIMIDPRRVLSGPLGSGSIDDVALAIREAADDGARVINLSLVVRADFLTLKEAVVYATSQGALVVAAAGNEYPSAGNVYWPAAYPEAVAVAALDYYDQPTTYSNRGAALDMAAPGGTSAIPVFSSWPGPSSFPPGPGGLPQTRCNTGLVQDGTGNYCTNYGTSFAAPAVAGAAALLLALEPTLESSEVRSILQDSATRLPYLQDEVGAGKLNIVAAVRELVPARFELIPSGHFTEVLATDDPYSYTVRIDNPGTQPISWTATLNLNTTPKMAETNQAFALPATWITMTGALSNTQSGSTEFGSPDVLGFTIEPYGLATGTYSSRLVLQVTIPGTGTLPSTTTQGVDITIQVNQGSARLWIPMLLHEVETAQARSSYVAYRWEVPTNPLDRQIHQFMVSPELTQTVAITPVESLTVTLPQAIQLHGTGFTAMRIHADGFVTFPATAAPFGFTPGNNQCLASPRWSAAVYGWWADLDVNAVGAQVSSFPLDDGRYVIEYTDVPSSAFALPAVVPYTVSFQIVLGPTGTVGLNYADAPLFTGEVPYVTVGAEAQDGLFYSQLVCNTPEITLGTVPLAHESFVIQPQDIY